MDTPLIETHYNRGRPMSDLALHAAQYFRPRKMHNQPIQHNLPIQCQRQSHQQNQYQHRHQYQQHQNQYQHDKGDTTSGAKRNALEIPDKANSATLSTPSKKNAPAPDVLATLDTHPTKRAKISLSQESGTLEVPITLSPSVKGMLARQASKPDPMISRRTRPVRAGAGVGVGVGACAGSDASATATATAEGKASEYPNGLTKETSSRVRRAAAVKVPVKGPTTSFAAPPKYRK